ncbi:thiol protease aleurain-like [Vanessa cardui]|uniref:thiol protease aleurain-like n=1 Tax=Vanessa cardui TaxID=171605 RepID=UPI001F12F18C|nr:thiol protease aleurain-like [Vanessa cardui]
MGKSALRYDLEDAYDYFETFIKTYGKQYDETEKAERFEIFKENLEKINDLNARSDNAVFGVTQFSDLTTEEFLQKHTGYRSIDDTDNNVNKSETNLNLEDTPESFDWRSKGVVSVVRDQGNCGSCWAFSTMSNVESAYAIKTNQSVLLSEQQLVDCATDNCVGCNGGIAKYACEYLKSKGAMSEDSYPYIDGEGKCKYNSKNVVVQVKNCLELSVSEDELATIAGAALHHYYGGLIANNMCSESNKIDHAVLLVGYGTDEDGNKYWVGKNSWGPGFGEQGFFKMQRGVNCLSLMDKTALAIEV